QHAESGALRHPVSVSRRAENRSRRSQRRPGARIRHVQVVLSPPEVAALLDAIDAIDTREPYGVMARGGVASRARSKRSSLPLNFVRGSSVSVVMLASGTSEHTENFRSRPSGSGRSER